MSEVCLLAQDAVYGSVFMDTLPRHKAALLNTQEPELSSRTFNGKLK